MNSLPPTDESVPQSVAPLNSSAGAPSGADALETPVDIGSQPDVLVENAAVVKKPRLRAKPKFAFPLPLKAVLLDLDGTLLDTVSDIATAANMMRASLGFAPLDAALIRTFVGKGIANLVAKTLKEAVGEVGPTALKVAVANFERQYEKCFGDSSAPFAGVIDGLEALRDKGLRLGCVTNKAEKFTLPLLAKTGLAGYFEITLSGDSLPEKKPHPLPLIHAAEFFACTTAEMLLIGDSVNDAEAARAAGSPVFIVPYGYNEGQELRGLDCDAFIDDVPSALKFVKLAT
ncbi:MAG: phosphoglycolate phosphatase [Betaproteobacteria bacterium]|nr:phosphoglycolate phosphatase [Betaproteobacteria bacterium]